MDRGYFSYIVVVSFIGGGNWITQRKPLTSRKSLTMRIIYKNDENKIGQLHVYVLVRIICSIIRGRHVPVM